MNRAELERLFARYRTLTLSLRPDLNENDRGFVIMERNVERARQHATLRQELIRAIDQMAEQMRQRERALIQRLRNQIREVRRNARGGDVVLDGATVGRWLPNMERRYVANVTADMLDEVMNVRSMAFQLNANALDMPEFSVARLLFLVLTQPNTLRYMIYELTQELGFANPNPQALRRVARIAELGEQPEGALAPPVPPAAIELIRQLSATQQALGIERGESWFFVYRQEGMQGLLRRQAEFERLRLLQQARERQRPGGGGGAAAAVAFPPVLGARFNMNFNGSNASVQIVRTTSLEVNVSNPRFRDGNLFMDRGRVAHLNFLENPLRFTVNSPYFAQMFRSSLEALFRFASERARANNMDPQRIMVQEMHVEVSGYDAVQSVRDGAEGDILYFVRRHTLAPRITRGRVVEQGNPVNIALRLNARNFERIVQIWMEATAQRVMATPSVAAFYLHQITIHMLTSHPMPRLPHMPAQGYGCIGLRAARQGFIRNGILAVSANSKNNNCFFACMSKHYGGFWSQDARILRRSFGLLTGTPISLEDVERIYSGYPLQIFDEQGELLCDLSHGFPHPARLLAHEGHFWMIQEMDSTMRRCEACGRQYRRTHSCNPERSKYYSHVFAQSDARVKSQDPRKKVYDPTIDILFFDIESFPLGDTAEHQVYAVGFQKLNDQEVQCTYGRSAFDEFMEEHVMTVDKTTTLLAFWGSRFDFHFVMRWLLEHNKPINEVVMSGTRILRLEFIADSGKVVTTWDLGLFVQSSLANACEDFKIPFRKSVFPHSFLDSWDKIELPQAWPEPHHWECRPEDRVLIPEPRAVWNTREMVLPYLILDVQCMASLFKTFSDVMREQFADVDVRLFLTLPHLSMHLWQRTLGNTIIHRPAEAESYDFIREALYGGRVVVSRLYYHSPLGEAAWTLPFDQVDRFGLVLDVNGLYAFCMLVNEFPVGPERWVSRDIIDVINAELCEGDHTSWPTICPPYGFMEISYIPPPYLLHPLLGRRINNVLSWDLYPNTGVYPLPEVKLAHEIGYKIVVKRMLAWYEGAPVFHEYISMCNEIKERGAAKDANGNEANPSLKQIGKLASNSVYGKQVQRVFQGEHCVCSNHEEILEFAETHEITNMMTFGDSVYIAGNKPRSLAIRQNAKPIQLGAYITSYARTYMYKLFMRVIPDMVEAAQDATSWERLGARVLNDNFYYTDTDSIHGDERLLERLGDVLGDGPGQLKNEYHKAGDGKVIEGIFVSPKLYSERVRGFRKERSTHNHAKGIPKDKIPANFFERIREDENYGEVIEIPTIKQTLDHQKGEGSAAAFSLTADVIKRTIGKIKKHGRIIRPDGNTVPKGWGGEWEEEEQVEELTEEELQTVEILERMPLHQTTDEDADIVEGFEE